MFQRTRFGGQGLGLHHKVLTTNSMFYITSLRGPRKYLKLYLRGTKIGGPGLGFRGLGFEDQD
jgi:hypothetical protein